MAFTEVLLIKPVDGLGAEGEQVRVRAGFARNFLLPQGIALPLNRSNAKYVEALKKAREVRESRDLESANATATTLAALKLVFAVKTGEGGKMFGAISTAEISSKLAEHGIEIERKRIHLGQGPVKLLGKHTTSIRLHSSVMVEQEFEVVSENPIEAVVEDAPEAEEREYRDDKSKKSRKPRKDKPGKSE